MKRFLYTTLFIVNVIAICVGLISIKDCTLSEACLSCGVIGILAIGVYKDLFNEFNNEK